MIKLSYEQSKDIGFAYVCSLLMANSPYGAQRIKQMRMFCPGEENELNGELDSIAAAIELCVNCNDKVRRFEASLMPLKDIRGSIRDTRRRTLDEVELFEVKALLLQLFDISSAFEALGGSDVFRDANIKVFPEAFSLLDADNSRTASFFISEKYSDRLKLIREEKRDVERMLRESGEEAKKPLLARRAQITADEENEERAVRELLSKKLAEYSDELLLTLDGIANADYVLARARLALRLHGVRPLIGDGDMNLVDMSNPKLAAVLEERGRRFTPVSIKLGRGATVITGANMGGKSIALKTVALCVTMAHAGMFVCAKYASLPLLESLAMVGAELEDSGRGLSSFGGEIMRLKEILPLTKTRSLLLFDEFARGTNPHEGARLAASLTKSLNQCEAISLITTHFDNVANQANAHYCVRGLGDFDVDRAAVRVKAGENGLDVISGSMNYGLYKVDKGAGVPRDAMNIVKLLMGGDDFLNTDDI